MRFGSEPMQHLVAILLQTDLALFKFRSWHSLPCTSWDLSELFPVSVKGTPSEPRRNLAQISMHRLRSSPIAVNWATPAAAMMRGRAPSESTLSLSSSSSDSTTDAPRAETDRGEVREKSTRRHRRQLMRQERLQEFLQEHQFSQDVCEPRTPGCCLFVDREMVYPIHIAAQEGDQELIRMLIASNADLNQRTSRGRTALEFAEEADSHGSHSGVLEFLRNDVKVLGLRQALQLLDKDKQN